MYVWREYMYFKTCGIFYLLTNNLDSVKILSKFFGVWLFLEKLLVQIELESSIYPYNFSRILTICFYVFSLYRYFQMSWKYFRQSCCPWIFSCWPSSIADRRVYWFLWSFFVHFTNGNAVKFLDHCVAHNSSSISHWMESNIL